MAEIYLLYLSPLLIQELKKKKKKGVSGNYANYSKILL